MGTPVLVQSRSTHNISNVTSLALAFSNPVTPGNALICHVGSSGGHPTNTFAVSDSVNGSYTQDNSNGGANVQACSIQSRFNTGSGTPNVSVTMTGTASPIFMIIEEWSNLGAADSVDKTAVGSNASASASSSSGATAATSQAGEIALGTVQLGGNASVVLTATGGGGWTLDIAEDAFFGASYNILSAIGPQTSTFNFGGGNVNYCNLVTTYKSTAVVPQGNNFNGSQMMLGAGS